MIAETKSSKPILLRRPRPFWDESISGFMIRLAEANGHTVTVMTAMTGFKYNKGGYVYGVTPLSEFSRMANVPEQDLRDLVYKPVNSQSPQGTGEYEIFGQSIPVLTIRHKTPKLCPECLKESPYQRKVWELSPVTACPHHKCLLLDACPKCEKKISYLRSQVCLCNCGFDFRKASMPILTDADLALSRRIYELLNFPIKEITGKTSHSQLPASLAKLNLFDLLSVLFFVIRKQHSDVSAGKRTFLLPAGEPHKLLAEAVKVFDDFPNNFYKFLDEVTEQFPYKVTEPQKAVSSSWQETSRRDSLRLAAEVRMTIRSEFIREALEEYLNRGKLNLYGINLDYEQTTAKKFFEDHTVLHAASKILESTKMACREMVRTGALRAYQGLMSSKRPICYINTKDIYDVKHRLEDAISIIDAAKLLGLKQYRIDLLIEAGLLKPISDLKISPVYTRITSRRQTMEIYEAFHKAMLANPAYGCAESVKIRWQDALKKFGKTGFDFSEVIKLIHENKLAPVGIDKSKEGLTRFVYDKAQIEQIIHDQTPASLAGTLSMNETCKLLKIKETALIKLFKKGYLHRVRLKGCTYMRVPIECVDNFCRQFTFSGEISRKFVTTAKYVNRKLTEKNISPVDLIFAPYNYLYRRADVENIIIEKVRKRSRKMPYRAEQIHTLEETAEMLNLTTGDLMLAVKRNLIYPFKGKDHSGLMFSDDRIDTFRKLNLPNLNYVKPIEASRIMELPLKTFKKYYLASKRIIPLVRSFGEKGKLYFFSISELEQLKQLEAKCIGSPEVAVILNICPSSVHLRASNGRLNPISGPIVDGYHNYRFLRSDIEEIKRKEIQLRKSER